MKRMPLLLLVLLAVLPLPAQAQYVWIDDKGVRQLSDRPPPPSVPERRILKAPGKPQFDPHAQAEAETPEAAPPKPPTTDERNAAYARRRADIAAADRLAAEDQARKNAEAANCAAARSNQRAIDDGLRLTRYDENGERHIMSDEERAQAARNNRQVLANCK